MGSGRETLGPPSRVRFGRTHLIAVAAGVVTALLVLAWTRSQDDFVSVLLAANDIRSGTLIEADDLRVTEMPSDSSVAMVMVPASEASALVGQVATRPIVIDEPILRTDLRPVVAEGGRRAMSFPLAPANAVGGELTVGDEVDVLVVTDDATRFVAERVPVLALPVAAPGGLVAGSSAWWVVLAVEDQDALEIAYGVEHGTIYLLRATGTPDLSIRELAPVGETGLSPPEASAPAGG